MDGFCFAGVTSMLPGAPKGRKERRDFCGASKVPVRTQDLIVRPLVDMNCNQETKRKRGKGMKIRKAARFGQTVTDHSTQRRIDLGCTFPQTRRGMASGFRAQEACREFAEFSPADDIVSSAVLRSVR